MNDIIPQTLIIFLFTSVVVTVRVRRPIRLRPPSDQIASAARRLMIRDRACVTTIIYMKLLLSGKQLFTLVLFCCSVFYSNIY